MSLKVYTIHVKPSLREDTGFDPDAVLVPEGFSFLALIFQGAWAMYHKLWLVAFIMFMVSFVAAILVQLSSGGFVIGFAVNLAIAVLIGAEARNLRRWTLGRHGYRQVGVVLGETLEDAERRYFEKVVSDEGLSGRGGRYSSGDEL